MAVLLKSTLNTAIQDGLTPFQNFRCKFPSSSSKLYLKTFSTEEQKILFRYLINNQNSKKSGNFTLSANRTTTWGNMWIAVEGHKFRKTHSDSLQNFAENLYKRKK